MAQQNAEPDAIARLGQAVANAPNDAALRFQFAQALDSAGRSADAIVQYTRAVALKPRWPEALNNLGRAQLVAGHLDAAITSLNRALALQSDHPQTHYNLGNAFALRRQATSAIACYERALALHPQFAEAHFNLANLLEDHQRLAEAIAHYSQASALAPQWPEAHNNLGRALLAAGRPIDAAFAIERAVALRPTWPEAWNNFGNARADQDQLNDAIALYERALAFKPDYADAHANLALARLAAGQVDRAFASIRRAIELQPDNAEFHAHHAFILLLQGDYSAGWKENEWRWRKSDMAPSIRKFPQPQWTGDDLSGRTILLYGEQGFGDVIQFSRYIPLLHDRGARTIVDVHPTLTRLLGTVRGADQVIATGTAPPPFDVHFPLMNLPLFCGDSAETIPHDLPYIHADTQAAQAWAGRLASDSSRLKVGLAWAGSTTHRNDRKRSLALWQLASLAAAADVTFYSLQRGDAAAQSKSPPAGMRLIDHMPECHDFADTAALIAALDLVISVDTAVAHLAGALGKPTWTLLPFPPDWRWLLARDDSPWYPTMRLFRQRHPGDWTDVIRRVAEALAGAI